MNITILKDRAKSILRGQKGLFAVKPMKGELKKIIKM